MGLALRAAGVALVFPTTPSVPRGLYLAWPIRNPSRLEPGTLVRACLPPDRAQEGLDRGYFLPVAPWHLEALLGRCPAGHALVLKTLLARGGETVVLGERGVFRGHQRLTPPPLDLDQEGRPLAGLSGAVRLPVGTVWLDTPHERSYGSRYFGPVPERCVTHRLWRILG